MAKQNTRTGEKICRNPKKLTKETATCTHVHVDRNTIMTLQLPTSGINVPSGNNVPKTDTSVLKLIDKYLKVKTMSRPLKHINHTTQNGVALYKRSILTQLKRIYPLGGTKTKNSLFGKHGHENYLHL